MHFDCSGVRRSGVDSGGVGDGEGLGGDDAVSPAVTFASLSLSLSGLTNLTTRIMTMTMMVMTLRAMIMYLFLLFFFRATVMSYRAESRRGFSDAKGPNDGRSV